MRRFIIIILFLFLFSCLNHKKTNPPEDLIEQELMSKIMLDVMLMKNITGMDMQSRKKEIFWLINIFF